MNHINIILSPAVYKAVGQLGLCCQGETQIRAQAIKVYIATIGECDFKSHSHWQYIYLCIFL